MAVSNGRYLFDYIAIPASWIYGTCVHAALKGCEESGREVEGAGDVWPGGFH